MLNFIYVLILFVCFLLVIVVLIQNSKGGGIASNFVSTGQLMGVKRQAELIEKITWGLAAALLILCLASSAMTGSTSATTGTQNSESVVTNSEKGTETPMAPNTNPLTPPPAQQPPPGN